MLRRKSAPKPRFDSDRGARPDADDYAFTLMVTAVIGTAANAASALIEIGRSAGWWH